MIHARPYSDEAAMAVFRNLDPWDQLEAEAIRGEPASHLALFGDWRAMRGAWLASWAVHHHLAGRWWHPFALVALVNTGQRGVASAALLACDHHLYRRPLVRLASEIRNTMPDWCASAGVHRIEARAWARHPRASAFLTLTGFRHEADMPGFGPDGTETFRQFAWTDPALPAAQP